MKKLLGGILSFFISQVVIGQTELYNWNSLAFGGGGFVSAVIMSETEQNLIYARTDVGGAYRWLEDSHTWKPLNDWSASNEAGLLGIESLAIDPQSPNIVYMLAGIDYFDAGKTAILKSEDYGETFTKTIVTSQFKAHGNGAGRQNGERLAVDPNYGDILFCGTRKNGLFKSSDAGNTWSHISALNVSTTTNGNGICFVAFDKESATVGSPSQTIYAGVSRMDADNFYVSNDGGTTWNAVANQPTGYMPQRCKIGSDGNLYLVYGNGAGPNANTDISQPLNTGAVWKYNPSNGNWTNISPSGFTNAWGGISLDPSNPNKIIISSINMWWTQPNGSYGDRFLISNDGGATWTDIIEENKFEFDINGISWIEGYSIHWSGCIEFDPFNTNRVFVTSGNGIFVTENLNASVSTWKAMVNGLEETVPLDIISIKNGPVISVIGDYDGAVYTDVTQYPRVHEPTTGTTTGIAYATGNSNKIVRVGNEMFLSNDMGQTWQQINKATTKPKGKVAISADGEVLLWCAENSWNVSNTDTYWTNNDGASWTLCTGLAFEAYPTADPVNEMAFYAYNNSTGQFFTSTNKGQSFTQTATLPSGGSRIMRLVPETEGDIWIPLGDNGLYRSTNSGTSFTQIASVTSCASVGFGKAKDGNTFPAIFIWGTVNGTTGLFRSDDEGATWIRINDDRHQFGGPGNGQFVIGDLNTFGRVYMSTAGRGIIYGEQAGGGSCRNPSLQGEATICSSVNIDLNTQIEDTEYSFQWFLDDASLPFTGSSITIGNGGLYRVVASKTGCPDTEAEIVVTSGLANISDATLCEGTSHTLEINGSGNYLWYDAPENGNLLATGTSYSVTPAQSETYYIENPASEPTAIGKAEQDAGNEGWFTISFTDMENQIAVEVTKPVTIESISVYAEAAGNVTISLMQGATAVYTHTEAVPASGLQVISLNFTVEPGNYVLSADGSSVGLYLQVSDAQFPYVYEDYLSFSNYQSWAGEWYGMFYDWKVSPGEECIRKPVTVDVEVCGSDATQIINFEEGWNLISFNVLPSDLRISTVFATISNLVDVIKNDDGFFSFHHETYLNSLSEINTSSGYLVLMKGSATLEVTGVWASNSIHISGYELGWHLIGCPYPMATDIETEFQSELTSIHTIKNFESFYSTVQAGGQLSNLTPNEGYFLLVK